MKNYKQESKNNLLSPQERTRQTYRRYLCISLALALVLCFTLTASASTDPLESINKLSDFIFSCIKAIGLILLGFGILQIGMSLKSHDPSQRANGFLTFFGGVVIAFAKDILDMIV